jgi:hypothetical protein
MLAGIQITAGGQLDWSSQPQTVGKILLVALKSQRLIGIPEQPDIGVKYRDYIYIIHYRSNASRKPN